MATQTQKKEKAPPTHTDKPADILKQRDLFTVLDVLKKCSYRASNYNSLGLALGIEYQYIKNIEPAHPRDVTRCLQEVIDLWLTNSTDGNPATWQKLVDAVERDNKAAAEDIAKEKIEGDHR